MASAAKTRERVLSAAQKLLIAPAGVANFTIDKVAEKATVARMTVYDQFGSRLGLIEAVADALALHHGVPDLQAALTADSLNEGVAEFIAKLGDLYETDRPLLHRLRALATLDPRARTFIEGRERGRRTLLREALLKALPPAKTRPETTEDVASALFALTELGMYEAIAGESKPLSAAVPTIQRLAQHSLQWLPQPHAPRPFVRRAGDRDRP